MDVKIYVCCHQQGFYVHQDGYIPIQVGKKNSNIDLGIDVDDTGDNISEKNPWYCELTAQYWIWKNVRDVDYVGLCHYRRYWDFNPNFFNRFKDYIHVNTEYINTHTHINGDSLRQYDVILPITQNQNIPLFDSLCMSHVHNDVLILSKVVEDLYPDFKSDYDQVILEGNKYSPYNMIIAKKEIFDSYSKWLFSILFEFEKRVSIPIDPYQPRVFGFYSERLLNVYFHHYHYKIGYFPTLLLDEKENKPFLLLKIRKSLRDLCSFLYKITR